MGFWALVPAGWSSAGQGPIDRSRTGKTQTDQGLTGQGLKGQSLTGQNLADQGPTGHTEQVNSWALDQLGPLAHTHTMCRHRMLVSVYHTVEIAVLQFGYIKGCATCRPSAGVGAVLQRFVSSHDGPFLVGPLWTPAHSMTQVFILMLNSIFNIRDIKLHRIYCCCISPKLVTVARHSRRG